jgi:tetratricopeptide (TPR) repeat protein
MPESTCLHIQDRESGPIRVVELSGISVRIGRAAHCEVRLTQHELADEICRLQRRGQSWRLLPGSTQSPVFLAGRRLSGSSLLPFDVPFRVGEYCLTLRRDRSAEPDWELYAGPAPPRLDDSEKPPVAEEEPDTPRTASLLLEGRLSASPPLDRPARGPISRAQTQIAETGASMKIAPARPAAAEPRPPRVSGFPQRDSRERWETRWKALGDQIKARADRNQSGLDLQRPAYQSDLKPIPLREPRVPMFQAPAPSLIGQAVAPLTTSGQAKNVPDGPPGTLNSQTCAETEAIQAADGALVEQEQMTDLPAEITVAEQSWQDEIAPELLVQIPFIQPERIDFDYTPATQADEPRVEGPKIEGPWAEEPPAEEPRAAIVQSGELEKPIAEAGEPFIPADESDKLEDPSRVLISAPRQQKADHHRPGTRATIEDHREAEPLWDRDSSSLAREVEWPSAKDILATYSASPSRLPANGGLKASRKRTGALAAPTVAKAPSCWAPPVWLVGPAAALFVVSTGLLGCGLSWSWARDSYMASVVTDRLLTSDRAIQRSPLPESVGPPEGGWMVSTAGHLAHWAIFLARFAGEEKQSPAESTALLERALQASPINPTARLALAQLEPVQNTTDVSIRSLGLSRDAVSLTWTARRLLAAGRKEDALKLYGRALSVAVPHVTSRSPVPRFIEDPGIRRYLLPGEEQVREIVADLVSQNAWMFEEWSGALPDTPTVLIATARLLREKGRSEAEAVLDRLFENKATAGAPGESGPVALAARAEALALRSRWKEADQFYRLAIDSMGDPTIARSWWFNLADISYRSDDETQRQAALRAASAVASSDDITRRAADIQRGALTRSNGVKAN